MRAITKESIYGCNYYRFNVEPVSGYLNAESRAIAAAPLIHSYSPAASVPCSRFVLKKPEEAAFIGEECYQVSRFLTVQSLDKDFFTDELNATSQLSIKPHYAISNRSGRGSQYKAYCNTFIRHDQAVLHHSRLQVHVHDGLVSPCNQLEALTQHLQQSLDDNQSTFIVSYVVDEQNKRILITHHCLIPEDKHNRLFEDLDELSIKPDKRGFNLLLDHVLSIDTLVIQPALQSFDKTVLDDEMPYFTQLFPVQTFPAPVPPQLQLHAQPESSHAPHETDFLGLSASTWIKYATIAVVSIGFVALILGSYGMGISLIGGASLTYLYLNVFFTNGQNVTLAHTAPPVDGMSPVI